MRNSIRNVHALTVVSILLFAVLLGVRPVSALAQGPGDSPGIDQLRQKAWSQGKVQVIVHFAVPRIGELSAASAKLWGADLSAEISRDRTVADADLTDAVEYSGWKILAELQGTEYEEVERFRYVPFIALRVSPGAFAVLEASPDVLGIEEDRPEKLIDPVGGAGTEGKGGVSEAGEGMIRPLLSDTTELVGAKTVWGWGYTGAGWYVAVLDTGIRRTHQFFTGKTIVEACRAKGRDGIGPAGDCPNGKAIQNGAGAAVHYADTYSGWDHGTHVAGIATGNSGSLAGVAKGADIIAVKVFSKFTAGDCGGSPCVMVWTSDLVAGLEYIYSLRGGRNISSVNLSLGGGGHTSVCNADSSRAAIDLLRSAGIATAVATGNSGWCGAVSSPACVPSAVAVGSSTKSDNESEFSNWHKNMQKLFAPGSDIYSSTGDSDSSYESWNGTSMATPHVAGAWALLKQAIPTGSVTAFLSALRNTGVGIASPCDSSAKPVPRIQIDKALTSILHFTLTIQSDAHGTTDPRPGSHDFPPGAKVDVTAVPSATYEFANWSADVSGTDNPVTVTMNEDKTIKANFRLMPKLTLQASRYGTTDPSPGAYYYPTGTVVQISAIPAAYCAFIDWSGGATGAANPLSVTMSANKSITANFRYVYAPIASGTRVQNRSFSQLEYINVLSWQSNPANDGLNIVKYKIYLVNDGTPALLGEVSGDQNQYLHREAGQEKRDYKIVAVHSTGSEGAPALVTVQ